MTDQGSEPVVRAPWVFPCAVIVSALAVAVFGQWLGGTVGVLTEAAFTVIALTFAGVLARTLSPRRRQRPAITPTARAKGSGGRAATGALLAMASLLPTTFGTMAAVVGAQSHELPLIAVGFGIGSVGVLMLVAGMRWMRSFSGAR